MEQQNNTENIDGSIDILRQRFFIEHDVDSKTFCTEEYTLMSKHNDISNIILTMDKFLPNLKIYDSDGEELSIMTNKHVKSLIEYKINKSDVNRKVLKNILRQFENREIFIIWIKLPPSKILVEDQIKIINLKYITNEENKKRKEFLLVIPSNKNHMLFYTIKKPLEHDFKKQNIFIKNKQGKEVEIKNNDEHKQDYFHENNTHDSLIITPRSKTKNQIKIHYKFKPKHKIILPSTLSVLFLSLISTFFIFLNYCQLSSDCGSISLFQHWFILLDKKFEITGFVIAASLILPRLVTNPLIRYKLFCYCIIPIILASVLALI